MLIPRRLCIASALGDADQMLILGAFTLHTKAIYPSPLREEAARRTPRFREIILNDDDDYEAYRTENHFQTATKKKITQNSFPLFHFRQDDHLTSSFVCVSSLTLVPEGGGDFPGWQA